MKFKEFGKKQKILLIFALIAVMMVSVIGTISYFSDKETITNNFTTGVLDIKTTETEWNPDDPQPGPDGQEDGKNTYPGYTRKKNPTVQNISGVLNNDSWIRATIRFYDARTNQIITDARRNELILHTIRYDGQGSLEENTATSGGYSDTTITALPNWNPAFKDMSATKGAPGVYVLYLNEVLKSAGTPQGGDSVTLFTTIAYPTEWTQSELDIMGDYRIRIEFAAIQKWTFANVDEAMEALYAEETEGTEHVGYERTYSGGTGNKENPNGDNTPSKMADPVREGEQDISDHRPSDVPPTDGTSTVGDDTTKTDGDASAEDSDTETNKQDDAAQKGVNSVNDNEATE